MKMRQHRLRVLSRMALAREVGRIRELTFMGLLEETPEERAAREARFQASWAELFSKMRLGGLLEPAVDDIVAVDDLSQVLKAAQEFVVVVKRTGEVVGTFDHLDDANAMIEKARRQKKASLVLLDTVA